METIEDAPAADVGRHSAIAVAPDGAVHITYADVTADVIHYARFDPATSSWTIEVMSCGCPGDGSTSAVAVDHAGGVHVVFGPPGSAAEWYRADAAAAWSTFPIWGGTLYCGTAAAMTD